MIVTKRIMYFGFYVVGILFYGVGSYLFIEKGLATVVEKKMSQQMSFIFGGMFFLLGIGALGYIFVKFFGKITKKKELFILLAIYISLVLISGFLVGLLGETLYEKTILSYEKIKGLMWGLTTYIQGLSRFLLLYSCLNLLLFGKVNWKNKTLKYWILGVFVLLSLSVLSTLFFTRLGMIVQLMVDSIIAIGIVYYYLFNHRYILEEYNV